MTPELQIALINLIARVGVDAAIAIASNIMTAPTYEDAIKAIKESQAKDWETYKKEA